MQMIALICASLELGEEDGYDLKPILLVAPKSLLTMWMEQLNIWANKLSITRYNGSHRKKSIDQRLFARTHITVTTYGEVRSELRLEGGQPRIPSTGESRWRSSFYAQASAGIFYERVCYHLRQMAFSACVHTSFRNRC